MLALFAGFAQFGAVASLAEVAKHFGHVSSSSSLTDQVGLAGTVLGLGLASQTTQNLLRTGECVLNLPDDTMAPHVDRIARTTGSDPVPEGKLRRGYRFVGDKFATAGLAPVASLTVSPPRALECPVQLEAVLEASHPVAEHDPVWQGRHLALVVEVRKVHAATDILMDGEADRIDPDKWRPLIMSFQHFYGLAPGKVHGSELAKIPEAAYRP